LQIFGAEFSLGEIRFLSMKRDPLQFFAGALAGFSFAAVLSFLSLTQPLSDLLSVSLLIFSISIPLGVFTFITPTYKEFKAPYPWRKSLYWVFAIFSVILPTIGFALVFWHLGFRYGVAYSVAVFLSYSLFARISSAMQEAAKDKPSTF